MMKKATAVLDFGTSKVLVVLMPYAGMIPMPTIAAILFIVAYNMCQ